MKYQDFKINFKKNGWFHISNNIDNYLYNNKSTEIAKIPNVSNEKIDTIINKVVNKKIINALNFLTPEEYLEKNKATRLMLFLTSQCNLNCTYCHCSSDNYGESMSEEFAFKIIDKYLAHVKQQTGNINDIEITFMGGGEPMLKINLIKEIVSYIENQGYNGDYVLVTNGTLGTDNDWKWLISKKFRITISADGPSNIQDKQRVFKNSSKQTSTILDKRLNFLSSNNVKIHLRSTVLKTDEKNIESICQYYDKYECIQTHSLEPVSIAGRATNLNINISKFYSTFFKNYSVFLYKNPSKYKSAWFKPFRKMDGFCGAVYYNAVVTNEGSVTLCTELDTNILQTEIGKKFIVGHINNDDNPFISKKSIKFAKENSTENLLLCKDCIARYKCGGGCYIKRFRDFNNNDEDYYNAFCKNIISLNISYLIGAYENKRK